jgi:hypothetical protein
MCSFRGTFIVFALAFAFASPCCAQPTSAELEEQVTQAAVYVLGPVKIEQKRISPMEGPSLQQEISLEKDPTTSTVWIKSLKVEVLDDQTPVEPEEFICHAVLKIKDHDLQDNKSTSSMQRLGREVFLAPGYGIRVDNLKSSTSLFVQTMNINAAPAFNARYRMTVKYIKDEDAKKIRLKNVRGVYVAVQERDTIARHSGMAAQPAAQTIKDDLNHCSAEGVEGADSTAFMVPSGQHTYVKVLERDHPIYKGGSIIAYGKHIHPYAQSMVLIDQTTNTVILPNATFKPANVRYKSKLNGLFYAEKGVPIDPNHTYAIKSVYNNTSNAPVDGMALLHIYIADKD